MKGRTVGYCGEFLLGCIHCAEYWFSNTRLAKVAAGRHQCQAWKYSSVTRTDGVHRRARRLSEELVPRRRALRITHTLRLRGGDVARPAQECITFPDMDTVSHRQLQRRKSRSYGNFHDTFSGQNDVRLNATPR